MGLESEPPPNGLGFDWSRLPSCQALDLQTQLSEGVDVAWIEPQILEWCHVMPKKIDKYAKEHHHLTLVVLISFSLICHLYVSPQLGRPEFRCLETTFLCGYLFLLRRIFTIDKAPRLDLAKGAPTCSGPLSHCQRYFGRLSEVKIWGKTARWMPGFRGIMSHFPACFEQPPFGEKEPPLFLNPK